MLTPRAALTVLLTMSCAGAASAASGPDSETVPDPPGVVLTRVATPTHVAARDGVVVFGSYDAVREAIVLMKRSPHGAIAPVGVPPIPARTVAGGIQGGPRVVPPFSVTLGHDVRHRLTAVYRRCSGSAESSCHLVLATLATRSERPVAHTRGAYDGAISGERVVFSRTGADGIDRIFSRNAVGRTPVALTPPTLGAQLIEDERVYRPSISMRSVDVRGVDAAYIVDYGLNFGEIAYSELWLNHGARKPRKVGYVGTGGGASGFRHLLQPRLYAHSVVAYMQGYDQKNAVFRYSLDGQVPGSASIGIGYRSRIEVTGGAWDRGHFWFSTNPSEGNGCAGQDQRPFDATCPVVDSGRLTLLPPSPQR